MSTNGRYSFIIKTIYYVLIFILIFLTVELGARFIENYGPRTFVFKQFDPDLGVSLMPNKSGIHRRCFDGYVRTNSFGMRDVDRTETKPKNVFRIGIFSDSVMEGLHVYPHQVAPLRLEHMLNREHCNGKCEVLNFSNGGYSTIEEYLKYERDGRKFNLDLIILVFTSNDLSNNLPDKVIYDGNLYGSVNVRKTDSGYEVLPPQKPFAYDALLYLNDNLASFRFFYKFYYFYIYDPLLRSRNTDSLYVRKFRFFDPNDRTSAMAWDITEYYLTAFAKSARRDGAQLILAYENEGNIYEMTPELEALRESYQTATGSNIDLHYISNRFEAWGDKENVLTVDLGNHLHDYIRSNNLTDVGLSYSCDAHLNPEGHKVVADFLFDTLIDNKILPTAQ